MGPTGAGKSTFINAISGGSLAIGNGLSSCTQHLDNSEFLAEDGVIVQLIDTPGFDDSTRSDVEILEEIALSLQAMYDTGLDIHGIIYMHRISDQRMSGSARRDLSTFVNICGPAAMKRTAIVTNMWGLVTPDIGEDREIELKEDPLFFKTILDSGATLYRNDNPPDSGKQIISQICSEEPVRLAIQVELSDENRSLLETTAGKELDRELTQQRAEHEAELAKLQQEYIQAQQKLDTESEDELKAEIALTQDRMEKIRISAIRLQEQKQIRSTLRMDLARRRSILAPAELPASLSHHQLHQKQILSPGQRPFGERSQWAQHGRELPTPNFNTETSYRVSALIRNIVLGTAHVFRYMTSAKPK